MELNQWDKSLLSKKVGIHLNDAQTNSGFASLNSGYSIRDILRPIDEKIPRSHRDSIFNEAIELACKISGVQTSLFQKFPSKLSTRISTYDDELSTNSDLFALSTSEWSLVLLTKVIAQVVASNDNPLSSPNSISKCLVGSILLLGESDGIAFVDSDKICHQLMFYFHVQMMQLQIWMK